MEWLKSHPWLVGGLVGVFLLVLVVSSSSSGSTADGAAPAAGDSSGTANDVQNYMASLNAQVQGAQIAAGVQNNQTDAAVEVARIQAGTADNANTLAAAVAQYTSKLTADVAINRDTLSAGVANHAADTTLATVQSNNLAQVQQSSIFAGALTQQAQINADTSRHYVDNLASIIGAQSQGAIGVAQAQRPCDSYLFGLITSC